MFVVVGVNVGVFVGVRVGVAVGVLVIVAVGVGSRYVYCTQTVAPAVVETWVMTLPAPPVEKDADAFTGSVTVSIGPPTKSLTGVYDDSVVDCVSVSPASVLPEGGMKSVLPS